MTYLVKFSRGYILVSWDKISPAFQHNIVSAFSILHWVTSNSTKYPYISNWWKFSCINFLQFYSTKPMLSKLKMELRSRFLTIYCMTEIIIRVCKMWIIDVLSLTLDEEETQILMKFIKNQNRLIQDLMKGYNKNVAPIYTKGKYYCSSTTLRKS